ncbi:MAG: hypothetical protein ACLPWF_28270 [Bryobacteraceae bacterium]
MKVRAWQRLVLLIVAAWQTQSFVSGEVPEATFEFHSGFWVNLHHTLYNQAAGKKAGRMPDLSALTPAETAAWNEALDYYGRNFINHDFLEPSMVRINVPLALPGEAASLDAVQLPEPVLQILEKAAPVYRAHWWPEHNRKNHEWIDQVTPLIAEYEKVLKPELSHAYKVAQGPDTGGDELLHDGSGRLHVAKAHPHHHL